MSGGTLLYIITHDGTRRWRPLIDLEHGTLCKQAGLDPNRYIFDFPSSARGVGSLMSGAGGSCRDGRRIDGRIVEAATGAEIGKIVFVREGDKFKDYDPTNWADALRYE